MTSARDEHPNEPSSETPSSAAPAKPAGPSRGRFIPALAVGRPVSVAMATLAAIVLSLFAYRSISMELIPSGFTPPFLFVHVPTLYSAPQDIELDVVHDVEGELGFVQGLDMVRASARRDSATFLLKFTDGTNMDVAYNEVREHVLRGIDDSAAVIGPPFIWKYNPDDEPVMWFGLTLPPDKPRPEVPIKDVLQPALESLVGVSRVEIFGLPSPEVIVGVDTDRARLVEGGMLRIVDRVARDNTSMALGEVSRLGMSLPLRFVASIDDPNTLRDLPVGEGVRLSDVADVTLEDTLEESLYRINAQPGLFVGVYRDNSANLVEVGRSVRAELERLTREDPALDGYGAHIFMDQAELIEGTLSELQKTALWGGLFAIIVLFVFLRRWQVTVIVAGAIPLSMLLTVTTLYLTGNTLNILSLTGIMLSVGLVVDNSIVVAESIQRARNEGSTAKEAAIAGAAEVALAVLVATLTSVAVFMPIMLMAGSEMLTFYLTKIGLPVCAGLLASLAVSLLVVPLLAAYVFRVDAAPDARLMLWLERLYGRWLGAVLRRRLDFLLVIVCLMATIVIPIKAVPVSDQSEANINDIRLDLRFESTMTWSERVDALLAYEGAILEQREELEIRDIRVGLGDVGIGGTEVRVFLNPPTERSLTRDELLVRFEDALPAVAGVRPRLSWLATGGGGETLRLQLVGDDTSTLLELADRVITRVEAVEGVRSVVPRGQSDDEEELVFRPDVPLLNLLGVSPEAVALTIDYALRGRQVSFMEGEDGARLPIQVRASLDEIDGVQRLEQLRLSGASSLTIADVTTQTLRPALQQIRRIDGETQYSLVVQTTRDDMSALSDEIDEALDGMPFPSGYGLRKAGRFEFLSGGGESRTFALALALVFVFVLMGILFESFLIPAAILFAVPFAAWGLYWTVFLTGGTLDVMVAIGLLILVGITVNNAIVLIDLARERERQGHGRATALVYAGERRLRPILMTAATTIIGMLPMALSRTTLVGIPYAPLGRAVIGGLIASTAITLFVVPVLYIVFTELAERLTRRP